MGGSEGGGGHSPPPPPPGDVELLSKTPSITQKLPDQVHASVHGEPKFIERQQPYVKQLMGSNPAKIHHAPECCGLWLHQLARWSVIWHRKKGHKQMASRSYCKEGSSPNRLRTDRKMRKTRLAAFQHKGCPSAQLIGWLGLFGGGGGAVCLWVSWVFEGGGCGVSRFVPVGCVVCM